jgi:L-alanine-DL-glutamate epimerase-like enolase superfamily enzyme
MFSQIGKLAVPVIVQPPTVIRRIDTFLYRAKVSKPVVSTITTLDRRVALLVRVEDGDGAFGWGEIYATMPTYGAEHRVQTLHKLLAPLVIGKAIARPAECWQMLTQKTYAMAIQTGELGPISAAIGGLDCALWDLFARRAGVPLCSLLASLPSGARVALPAYASGLNPADGPEVVEASRARGFRAFKQKIGFGEDVDIGNLQRIRAGMQAGEALMVDVNQGWPIEEALRMAPKLTRFDLAWVEEPLLADRPASEWRQCAQAFSAVLAGGENLRADEFTEQSAWLGVIQPDVGKWGGISASWAVARAALAAGKRYCPHWLGAGIGLMASAHLLAAAGGDGMLEIDVNENPLREALCQPFPALVDGALALTQEPGFGVEPDRAAASGWLVQHDESA